MLSQITGKPILPISVAASRTWSFHTWDRFELPLPFSRVVIAYGEPVKVPRAMDADALARTQTEMAGRLMDSKPRQSRHSRNLHNPDLVYRPGRGEARDGRRADVEPANGCEKPRVVRYRCSQTGIFRPSVPAAPVGHRDYPINARRRNAGTASPETRHDLGSTDESIELMTRWFARTRRHRTACTRRAATPGPGSSTTRTTSSGYW